MSTVARAAGRWAGCGALGVVGVAGVAYATSPGFRRSVTFWSTISPFMIEFYGIKARAQWLDGCSSAELEKRLEAFHQRSAAHAVGVILMLGGIYVKLGQVCSTIGAGILEDAYITALRPLQDGVPPRSVDEVSAIIEASVGARMSDLFESFDPLPVGAASIAQAHRATLVGGARVIVKVQYPEVAELYDADFRNLEAVTQVLFPENLALVEGLRKRHAAELDFRTEAAHLRECSASMRARGFEPSIVRIPAVPEARLCTRHVLAMEFLEGQSLAAAIESEQDEMATALGLGSARELRAQLMRRIKAHFKEGGGSAHLITRQITAVAPIIRAYAAARRRLRRDAAIAWHALARCAAALSLGLLSPPPPLELAELGAEAQLDLGHALRTLVRVHGVQMLLDGVYNADPHPGNVIMLRDGRLGLIDYGMVGRLTPQERENVARVVLGLQRGDRDGVADLYHDAGYRTCWHSGAPHGRDVVHRFAAFHLDKIDLSPVAVGEGGECMPIMQVLKSTLETSVPDWIEQARRLGSLLIGVASQAGRPISLAHEWAPIAEEVLRQRGVAADHRGPGRGRVGAAADPPHA